MGHREQRGGGGCMTHATAPIGAPKSRDPESSDQRWCMGYGGEIRRLHRRFEKLLVWKPSLKSTFFMNLKKLVE